MKIVKKISLILLMIINIIYWFDFEFIDVFATSGSIRQNSVIECNGKYYGAHGNPLHWHLVEKKDGKWVSISSKEVNEPSCYTELENEKIEVTLSKCVDGDTAKFKTSSGEIKTTRFLAIDTPESVHPTKEVELFGKDASKYTCSLLTNAKKIILEFDKNSEKEDKYGRLLAYVYADGKMVQESLIEVGYAKVAYLYADYTHTEYLQKVEAIAKEKKVGIWNDENITNVMDEEANGDSLDNSTTPLSKNNGKNDKIWSIIWDFLEKILSKLFNSLENML